VPVRIYITNRVGIKVRAVGADPAPLTDSQSAMKRVSGDEQEQKGVPVTGCANREPAADQVPLSRRRPRGPGPHRVELRGEGVQEPAGDQKPQRSGDERRGQGARRVGDRRGTPRRPAAYTGSTSARAAIDAGRYSAATATVAQKGRSLVRRTPVCGS